MSKQYIVLSGVIGAPELGSKHLAKDQVVTKEELEAPIKFYSYEEAVDDAGIVNVRKVQKTRPAYDIERLLRIKAIKRYVAPAEITDDEPAEPIELVHEPAHRRIPLTNLDDGQPATSVIKAPARK